MGGLATASCFVTKTEEKEPRTSTGVQDEEQGNIQLNQQESATFAKQKHTKPPSPSLCPATTLHLTISKFPLSYPRHDLVLPFTLNYALTLVGTPSSTSSSDPPV
jgi:hypothetical protein